jgi:serine/threonine protein kinase
MSTPPPGNRWPELAALVDALLDAPPERRESLIAELSGGDPARRAELEALLRECEQEPALLRRSAPDAFAALFEDEATEFPPALASRYRVTRELGRGGMATVYLARDLRHERDVAVKVVQPAVASALGADRFLREIEIVARLHHPHIVPLFDSGESGGSLFYVMPYETGLSVRERLTRDGPLPVEEVVVILRDVCDALAYAHEHGVVHRDIKPDNVLLYGRHAMVADFGVAKAAGVGMRAGAAADGGPHNSATSGLLLGTPAYMAPEQSAAGTAVDHRADIYAVGVLGYELLTGRPPFTGPDPGAILAAHRTEMPVPVTERRPGLPAPLAALVMKGLSKSPEQRWQSADDMVRELDALAVSRSGAVARSPRERWIGPVAAVVTVIALAAVTLALRDTAPESSWPDRWSRARIERLTDFPGSEVDAAISADGRFVAFLADRDSAYDAFAGRIGSGQWTNLSRGRLAELFNEDVRNIGFAPDPGHVWLRIADISSPATVALVPAGGGTPVPFLPTAVMAAWSPDGSQVAYHETSPGDPIYIARRDGTAPRRIYVAEPGVHSHHLSWSHDGRFLYFTHGVPPDEMDVWRIGVSGGAPERLTHHNSRVAHPVPVDERSLLYTATAEDGTGPWLHAMDLDDRSVTRLSTGIEQYLSVAAATADTADGMRRLVATVSNPAVELWSVPVGAGIVEEEGVVRLDLPTSRAAAPRFAPDSALLYLASRGGADGVWRIPAGGERSPAGDATEVWRPEGGAVAAAIALSPDGGTMCFPVRRGSRSTLHCTARDGSGGRDVAASLDVRGAASWSPDGRWIAVAARVAAGVRVFKVPLDGGSPVQLVDSASSSPVWSPDGRFILYSGAPRARSVPVLAVTPRGTPFPVPPVAVDRVGDSYRFLPGGRSVILKLGGFRRQDFWLMDLATGARRQLTRLRPGESIRRFDVSPDGTRLVFERVRENSDVVLIEVPGK